jgi:hypothetical protein
VFSQSKQHLLISLLLNLCNEAFVNILKVAKAETLREALLAQSEVANTFLDDITACLVHERVSEQHTLWTTTAAYWNMYTPDSMLHFAGDRGFNFLRICFACCLYTSSWSCDSLLCSIDATCTRREV